MWDWLMRLLRGYNVCGECKHLHTCWRRVDDIARKHIACDDFELNK